MVGLREQGLTCQQAGCCTVFIFETTKVQDVFCTFLHFVFLLGFCVFFETCFLGFLAEYMA